jgi:hypothetical protein
VYCVIGITDSGSTGRRWTDSAPGADRIGHRTAVHSGSEVDLLHLLSLALAAEPAAPPPNHGVLLSIDAYGRMLNGHVLADTKLLEGAGIQLWVEDQRQTGVVPLMHGMRVLGLEQGERLVDQAIDSLMYFDKNKDTYLDGKDPGFAALSLFVDANADARIQPGEVRTLAAIGVDSISRFGSIRMKERR